MAVFTPKLEVLPCVSDGSTKLRAQLTNILFDGFKGFGTHLGQAQSCLPHQCMCAVEALYEQIRGATKLGGNCLFGCEAGLQSTKHPKKWKRIKKDSIRQRGTNFTEAKNTLGSLLDFH